MKLAAIYNVWDGEELLEGSMTCLKYQVDVFIIVYQNISNYGEYHDPIHKVNLSGFKNIVIHQYHPDVDKGGFFNEKSKRNIGIDIARKQGCTHFLHLDVDEYYDDFAFAKTAYVRSGQAGSVCKIHSYFKSPTLRFERPDNYYVPFIHQLKPDTIAGDDRCGYPFYVDPTRVINEKEVIVLPIYMDHYSWVRKDINRKARNSSAKKNIEKSTLLQEYNSDLREGSYADGGRRLIQVENKHQIYL
jgi:hypothetical protein